MTLLYYYFLCYVYIIDCINYDIPDVTYWFAYFCFKPLSFHIVRRHLAFLEPEAKNVYC